ncbi:SGNH/GDSL hydrolase family protein [Shimia thalassica]|uniref:SGNH/GDSL hydrolase family protein n=1 Tax=Shimia thalassica TaxID=1715693 RepID=UPI0026E2B6FB|nr:SGNH/GDSL hydrolase family protein [Shimia thalassica]MDO6799744.1 SGNH/GDSL hydrolase family protein [Shimia thalassica]
METPFKVCVIGGSNSLMKSGYIPPFKAQLSRALKRDVEINNISMGGTFSHYGLWQLITKGSHKDADVIVIEYALNDSELSSFGMIGHWAQAYEGVIAKLRAEAPSAKIISPLFINRHSAMRSKFSAMAAGFAFINGRYDVETIDVNNELLSRAPEEYWTIDEWYKDGSHYTKYIQVMIADFLVEAVKAGKGHMKRDRVFAVTENHFGGAKSAVKEGIFDGLFPPEFERTNFTNSLVSQDAIKIPTGGTLEFNLKGSLVGMILVSTDGDGIVRCTVGNHSVLTSCRRKAFDTRKFDFLMNIFVLDQYFRKTVTVSEDWMPISLRVLTPEQIVATAGERVATRPTARPAEADQKELSFCIADIVYNGEIEPIN